MALSTRTQPILARLFAPHRASFGYLDARQRRAFDELAALVPQNAVVGSTLNGGAVELYTGRAAVHPAPWAADEFVRFVHLMAAEGRAVYLLDDGMEMQPTLDVARERLNVSKVGELFLPYYLAGGNSRDRFVTLYLVQVEARHASPLLGRKRQPDQTHSHPSAPGGEAIGQRRKHSQFLAPFCARGRAPGGEACLAPTLGRRQPLPCRAACPAPFGR
ncbi:MAG TPA: hypothetical protein EYH32_03625 [Anaerolineae bacterium]|nr:hypothetical protein [Anaerolineae bacterium]